MIRDFSAVSYGAFYRTLWRMNEAHDLRRATPASNDTEYRPRSIYRPTLGSGREGHPPEGTSGCGTTGSISGPRMDGNAEIVN